MKMFQIYKNLDKKVYALSGYRLIVGLGYFVIPYLSLYLTEELHISVTVAGVIVAVANLFCIPMLQVAGKLCVRIGNEKLIIISQCVSAACYICVLFTETAFLEILLIILAFGFTSMTTPALDACLSASTDKNNKQRGFSLMYFCQNIGIAAGSLIIGSVYHINPDFIFWGDAITTLVGTIIFWLFCKKYGHCFEKTTTNQRITSMEKTSGSVIKRYRKKPMFAVIFINALAYGQVSFLLPLFLNDGLADRGSMMYGVLMMVNAVCVIALSPVLTHMFAKWKVVTSLLLGELLFALGYGTYIISGNEIVLILATLIWSIGEILFSISHMPYIVEGVSNNDVGTISATIATFNKIGSILSSMVGASIIYFIGYEKSWGLISLFMMSAVGIVVILRRKER